MSTGLHCPCPTGPCLTLGLILLWLGPAGAVRSFGTGNAGSVCLGAARPLFAHTLPEGSAGRMGHLWTTGSASQGLAQLGVELRFNYFLDGEPAPSISLDPAKAAGQFFDAVAINGTWEDGTLAATPGNLSMFTAGDKAGKNAVTQGWWNQLKIPFSRSVNITVSLVPRPGASPKPGTCAAFYAVVRGHEIPQTGPAVVLPSGFAVPAGARLVLSETDAVVPPNSFRSLLNVSAGHEALLYGLGLGLETSPPWGTQVNGRLVTQNNYVEGCWSLLRNANETLPGMLLGTGLEDFFDSGYGFSLIDPGVSPLPPSTDTDGEIRQCNRPEGAAYCSVTGSPFQHPSSGVLHFSSDYANSEFPRGVERFSAYRYFDAEVVGMDDGGQFGWTNGCAAWNKPGTNKCGVPAFAEASELGACQTSPTRVTAYVWAYVWPKAA